VRARPTAGEGRKDSRGRRSISAGIGHRSVFLNDHAESFDAVTCAATLIHFGDLRPAFDAAAKSLRDGGLFIFTLFPNEADENAIAVGSLEGLGQGGCYQHGRAYVARLAEATGFVVESLEREVHEYRKQQPLMGLLGVLRRLPRSCARAA
jgi:predicted TPR repeat methyltransferase